MLLMAYGYTFLTVDWTFIESPTFGNGAAYNLPTKAGLACSRPKDDGEILPPYATGIPP